MSANQRENELMDSSFLLDQIPEVNAMQGRRLGEELMGQMAGESSTIGCTVVKYSETGEPTLRTFRTSTPEDVKSLKWSRYPTEASVLTWVHPKQTDALEAIAVMKAENGALTKFLEAEGHELGGDMEIKALRPSDRADHRNQLAKTQAAKKFSHSTLTQGRTNAAWKFMYENNEEERHGKNALGRAKAKFFDLTDLQEIVLAIDEHRVRSHGSQLSYRMLDKVTAKMTFALVFPGRVVEVTATSQYQYLKFIYGLPILLDRPDLLCKPTKAEIPITMPLKEHEEHNDADFGAGFAPVRDREAGACLGLTMEQKIFAAVAHNDLVQLQVCLNAIGNRAFDLRNKGGLNLLDLAMERNHKKAIQLLESRGAHVTEDTKLVGRAPIKPVVIAHDKEPELPPHKMTPEEWELNYRTGLWLVEELIHEKCDWKALEGIHMDLEHGEKIRVPAVGFELDGHTGLNGLKMTADSSHMLKRLCKVLRVLSEVTHDLNLTPVTIHLTGFTNCAKPADAMNPFNVRKSTERARVVAQAIKKFKVGSTKIKMEGAGGTKPIDKDPSVNARVEIQLHVPPAWREKKRLAVLVYTDPSVQEMLAKFRHESLVKEEEAPPPPPKRLPPNQCLLDLSMDQSPRGFGAFAPGFLALGEQVVTWKDGIRKEGGQVELCADVPPHMEVAVAEGEEPPMQSLIYKKKPSFGCEQVPWQFFGNAVPVRKNQIVTMSCWIKFIGKVPPIDTCNIGFKHHLPNVVTDGSWLDQCVPDEWQFVNTKYVVAESGMDLLLLIFDTAPGGQEVVFTDLRFGVEDAPSDEDYVEAFDPSKYVEDEADAEEEDTGEAASFEEIEKQVALEALAAREEKRKKYLNPSTGAAAAAADDTSEPDAQRFEGTEETKGEPEDDTPLGMDAETEELSNILDEAAAASMPSADPDAERIAIVDDESVVSGQDDIIHNTREEADY